MLAIAMILLTYSFSYLIPALPGTFLNLLHYLPYILILIIIVHSIVTNRSRDLNLSLTLILCYWILQNLIWPTDTNDTTAIVLYALIGIVLASNFFINCIIQERGILTKQSLYLTVFLFAEIIFMIWFVYSAPQLLKDYLFYPYFLISWLEMTQIYQSTLLLLLIALLVLLIKAIRTPRVVNSGFLGALIAVTLALHFINAPITSMMFYTVACLIMILALSLDNFHLTKIDVLTELPGKRAFRKKLLTMKNHYCIAILDIDQFSKTNKKYGLDICNQILRMIASRSRDMGRKGLAYRYAGEEFAIIFYDMKLNEAHMYLGRLCNSIANEPFLLRRKRRPYFKPLVLPIHTIAKPVHVSVTVGVAEKQSHHKNPVEVLRTAKDALNRAKLQAREELILT